VEGWLEDGEARPCEWEVDSKDIEENKEEEEVEEEVVEEEEELEEER
jgi:hypothetical protein